MEGECNSMSELYKIAPSFVPRPHAWGKFQIVNPVTHFFLCDFLDLGKELPEPSSFCARLAEIHRNSVSYWKVRLHGAQLPWQNLAE